MIAQVSLKNQFYKAVNGPHPQDRGTSMLGIGLPFGAHALDRHPVYVRLQGGYLGSVWALAIEIWQLMNL
jgi:hypothetical protein